MRPNFFGRKALKFLAGALILAGGFAQAQPQHGIAMYGDPALPPDFVSLPYANPDAPKGGRLVTGEVGSFDSLNPHILKGRVPWQLRFLGYESLMGRNWDEPFGLYGLLAESIRTGPNREWVEFTLRPEARFSDGTPVTVEDVLWSYETLGTIGHRRYQGAWEKVAKAEALDDRTIRFTFNTEDRELALVIGLRPILKKAQWQDKDFTASGLDTIPIGTSPYVVSDFEAGRHVTLTRNPDYWGKDLPFRRGTLNFDEIRMEFFGDGTAMFEAFKAGEINTIRETSAAKWDSNYDFPAMRAGEMVKSEIAHQRPSGLQGLVFNTRRPIFADWRVRDALIHAFNFEFINKTLTGGDEPRITSYFSNSVLGMADGPAEGPVRDLLEPFAAELLPGALEGYALPVSDGRPANRKNLRKAFARLEEAGWVVADDGVLRNAAGTAFSFEILLKQGADDEQKIVDIYAEALKRLGITPRITQIDKAQFNERTNTYDFDMAFYQRGASLSPGNEQFFYWSADSADTPRTPNWMGMKVPAAEAMIERLVNAQSADTFLAAARALDRILASGRYVIPIWHAPVSRIAHDARLKYPEHVPMYGDWIGFHPDVWWFEEN